MYFIDSWDNEKFLVTSDRYNTFISTKDPAKAKNWCGGTYKHDEVRFIGTEFAHSGSTLTVSMQDFLDEAPDNESWGFRDFRVFIHTCGGEDAGCKEVARELFEKHLVAENV